MGLIGNLFGALFGGGRNAIAETVEVFQENKEAAAERQAAYRAAALQQFASEFVVERKGLFDRFMDALNRVPRPAMALGTLGLFVAAMTDPIWFSSRMQGIALVPEPLWWLMGAIVSFYFGARYQVKSQDFRKSLAASVGRANQVTQNIKALQALSAGAGEMDPDDGANIDGALDDNPALSDWRSSHDG